MTRTILMLACAVSLSACGWYGAGGSAGNPSNTPYAGEPGSIYDGSGPLRPVQPEPELAPLPQSNSGNGALLPPVSPAPRPQ